VSDSPPRSFPAGGAAGAPKPVVPRGPKLEPQTGRGGPVSPGGCVSAASFHVVCRERRGNRRLSRRWRKACRPGRRCRFDLRTVQPCPVRVRRVSPPPFSPVRLLTSAHEHDYTPPGESAIPECLGRKLAGIPALFPEDCGPSVPQLTQRLGPRITDSDSSARGGRFAGCGDVVACWLVSQQRAKRPPLRPPWGGGRSSALGGAVGARVPRPGWLSEVIRPPAQISAICSARPDHQRRGGGRAPSRRASDRVLPRQAANLGLFQDFQAAGRVQLSACAIASFLQVAKTRFRHITASFRQISRRERQFYESIS